MIAIVLIFAALFGLAEFAAISNLLVLPAYYDLLGIGEATPWPLLVGSVIIPPLFFGGAFVLGRHCVLFDRALILAVALAATHALALSSVAVANAIQPAIG